MGNPKAWCMSFEKSIIPTTKLSQRQIKQFTTERPNLTVEIVAKKSMAAAQLIDIIQTMGAYLRFADAELRKEIEGAGADIPIGQKQAPVAATKPRDAEASVELDNVVVIEHCINCKAHNTHLRHDEQKYLTFAQQLSAAIASESGKNVQALKNEVPKVWADRDTYCQLIPCYDEKRMCYSMIPRVGAFEVSICGVIIFSKLCL